MSTTKTAPKFERPPGYEGLEIDTLEYDGTTYVIRELRVKEGDEIERLSKQEDGSTNGRLSTRLTLAKAIIEPATTIEQIEDWGSKKYVALVRKLNDLNTLPPDPTPLSPNGSSGPSSPSGGTASPTT